MFESRHRSSSGASANRWLIVAGAGLVILAFVARMLLDIGNTKVSGLVGVLRPDTLPAPAAPTVPPPLVLKNDTAAAVAPASVAAPVQPATIPAAAAAPPVPVDSGYAVQIGAFGSKANAARLRDRASALGYDAAVLPQASGASALYLVRVKDLKGAKAARMASDSLARALRVTAVVLPPER